MKKVRFWVVIYKFFILYYLSILFINEFTILDGHDLLVQFITQMIALLVSSLSEYQERWLRNTHDN